MVDQKTVERVRVIAKALYNIDPDMDAHALCSFGANGAVSCETLTWAIELLQEIVKGMIENDGN